MEDLYLPHKTSFELIIRMEIMRCIEMNIVRLYFYFLHFNIDGQAQFIISLYLDNEANEAGAS